MSNEKFQGHMGHMCHKTGLRILIGLVLIALILFLAAKTINEFRNEPNIVKNAPQATITASGEGKIYAKPDIGEINVGVTNEAKTVAEAQTQSTNAINKIVAFLKSAGVEEKDIKTTNYNINPVYDYAKGKQVLRGYQVSQNLGVKIRNLEKSGDILAGATENGANIVGGINFTIDNPDSLKEQARSQAIAQAKDKAAKLAVQLGISLGKLINYSESGTQPPIFYAKSMAEGIGGAPSPEIPTGENEIIVDVSITYEIR